MTYLLLTNSRPEQREPGPVMFGPIPSASTVFPRAARICCEPGF